MSAFRASWKALLEPGTRVDATAVLVGRCLDPEDVGEDGFVSDRSAWSDLSAQVVVSRPAEEAAVSLDSEPHGVGPDDEFPENSRAADPLAG